MQTTINRTKVELKLAHKEATTIDEMRYQSYQSGIEILVRALLQLVQFSINRTKVELK